MTEPAATVIRLEAVSKRFTIRHEKSLKERMINLRRRGPRAREDFWALRDVTTDIQAGTTVGLIGRNGSGKSTMLKMIGGIIEPTSGRILRRGRLAALLELGAGFHPDLTGRENVFLNAAILGMSRQETLERFDSIVDFSGIEPFIDTQVKFYSSGMYVRLAFAVAVHVDPDILLVDEVLAVGDEPFQQKCLDKIRSFQNEGKTIIMVTHSLATVGDMCDRAIVMDHGSKVFDGDVPTALHTLRELFTQQPETSAEVSTALSRITGARIVDRKGEPVTVVAPGEQIRVEVDVHSDTLLEGWYVGIGIEGNLGQPLFGTNTERLDLDLPPLLGDATVVFDLPDVRLGTDRYSLHASLGTTALGTFQKVPAIATLDAEDNTNNVGILAIDASVGLRR